MKRYIVNSIAAGLIFLFSCAKKEKIGPDLGEVKGPVEFEESFTVSNTNPNFTNGDKVYFAAKFKADAHWLITLKGANSGAIKTFEGTGRTISASNVMWDGSVDSIPCFRREAVVAELSFPEASNGESASASHNISIAKPKNLDYGHVLVTSFDDPLKINNIYTAAGWDNPPADRWPSNFAVTATHNDLPLVNPDTNSYCIFGPQAAWENNMDFPGHKGPYLDHMLITAFSVGYGTHFPLIGNPEQIYFNIMVNRTSKEENKYQWLQITLTEDHPILAGQVVEKSYNLRPNWTTGWKLVTIPYTEFIGTENTYSPQRIRSVQLTLLSGAPQEILDAGTDPVEIAIDHLVFTHFKPLQP
jgi:hypothetical protein